MVETWDLYDEDRVNTNQTIEKGKLLPNGKFRLVVHICIFNDEHQMLIQQRKEFKHSFPNFWDLSVGGSVMAGENSKLAAQREVKEELGVDIDLNNNRPLLTFNFKNGFDDIYLIKKNVNIEDIVLQDCEVKNVKWASKAEILNLIKNSEFIPYFPSFIETLFDMITNSPDRGHNLFIPQHQKEN